MKPNYGRDVWFSPAPDLTTAELVRILKLTVFSSPGYEFGGAYQRMPEDLRRHFVLVEPSK